MIEVILIKKEFFELTKANQRKVLLLLFYWIIKEFIKTFKNK